ncbi:hypothetical protein AAC387_Pa09g0769 [Persea americana]
MCNSPSGAGFYTSVTILPLLPSLQLLSRSSSLRLEMPLEEIGQLPSSSMASQFSGFSGTTPSTVIGRPLSSGHRSLLLTESKVCLSPKNLGQFLAIYMCMIKLYGSSKMSCVMQSTCVIWPTLPQD